MPARSLAVALLLLGAEASALAAKPVLERLSTAKLAAMPPLLKHGDVALIESQPSGRLRQITIMTLVKAPAKVVHDVVADPARQPEYVHNMSKSQVARNADGTLDHTWVMDFTVTSFNGTTRYTLDGDGTIVEASTDPEDNAIFRWEFLTPPGSGGRETVLVMYGYTDVMHSNGLIRSIVKGAPMMEHGLALASHLVMLRSFKQRAEALAASAPASATVASVAPTPTEPAPRSPGFGFLLDRGKVAVVRSTAEGRLGEISLMDRIYAETGKVAEVVERPADYSRFVDTVKRSRAEGTTADGLRYSLELSIPLVSWESEYLMRRDPRAPATAGMVSVDGAAVGGDLKGARFRWDLQPVAAKETLATLRVQESLGASSLVLRTLFKQEPLFEHGIAVALGLVELTGVRGHAEGWK